MLYSDEAAKQWLMINPAYDSIHSHWFICYSNKFETSSTTDKSTTAAT